MFLAEDRGAVRSCVPFHFYRYNKAFLVEVQGGGGIIDLNWRGLRVSEKVEKPARGLKGFAEVEASGDNSHYGVTGAMR